MSALTEIERQERDESRRMRNRVAALVVIALVGGVLNYVTM